MSKQDIYEQEIMEHVSNIIAICRRQKIPCFMTFAVGDNEKDETYITKMVSPSSVYANIQPDLIAEHVKMHNGFRAVLQDTKVNTKEISIEQ